MNKLKKRGSFHSVSEFVTSHVGNLNSFVNPNIVPFLQNLDEAVACIQSNKGKHFAVVGDYDMDGMASSFILKKGLTEYLGYEPYIRIPHRFNEGYGISPSIVDEIRNHFADVSGTGIVLITCDNGIAAHDAIKKAKQYGMTVIITDHHLPTTDTEGKVVLPPADIIIDPHADTQSHYIHYCGAGLAYRLISRLLNKKCEHLLVVAGIATVADMVPLIGANRYLVQESLQLFRKGNAPDGLRVLANRLNISVIYEDDYGYKIGPCFNALSRLTPNDRNDAMIAIELLESNIITAESIAAKMLQTNQRRKELSKEADENIKRNLTGERPIIICDEQIHPGIIGIVAGNICEEFQCPTIVFTKKDGICVGSGRSIAGWHLKQLLDQCKDLLVKYGGHESAAGLSIKEENLEEFKKRFIAICGEIPPVLDCTYYDIEAYPADIPNIKAELDRLAPYGIGNPKPVICIKIPPMPPMFIGNPLQEHFKFVLPELTILGFYRAKQFQIKNNLQQCNFRFVGNLTDHWFNGKHSIQLVASDFD